MREHLTGFVVGVLVMAVIGFVLLSLTSLNNRVTNIERYLSQKQAQPEKIVVPRNNMQPHTP